MPLYTISALALLLPAIAAHALDIDVDQGWGPTTSSHHLHFAGGAAMGAVGYAGLRVVGLTQGQSFFGSSLVGSAVGVAYEIKNDRHGQDSFADPADATYTAAGVLVGAAIGYLTEEAVQVMLAPDAVAVAWEVKL